MYSQQLKKIVDTIVSKNPAFHGKGFVYDGMSDFKGVTDEYYNYVYGRVIDQDGDKSLELTALNEGRKGLYMGRFEFKIIVATKCCNDTVIPIVMEQLEKIRITNITAIGDCTEHIYKEETGEDLKREDVFLYALYGEWKGLVNPKKITNCLDKTCIDVNDCC